MSTPRRGLAAIAAAAVFTLLAACGSGGLETEGSQDSAQKFEKDSVVSSLPKNVQASYRNLAQPVAASPWADFKPAGKPPWTIGYSSEYAGNSWRAEGMNRLMKVLLPKYKAAGLVDKVIVTQSNLDDSLQNQQIRQLVDQGADAVLTCCASTTALNQSVKYAHDKGVPFFVWSGYITSPHAINSSANYRAAGATVAKSLFDKIGGKGNVLDVVGIPGAASSDSFEAGVQDALKDYPDIKIVGTVAGKWTDQVAKTEVQKFLGTHPEKIDGVIAQAASDTGALQGLIQSGRPVVPVTLGGEVGAACYWRKHPDFAKTGWHVWPPGDEMQLSFEVMMRTLQGQGPKIQSIVRNIAPFSHADVVKQLPANCDENSDAWLQPGPEKWFPSSEMDKFFKNPQDPLTWKPE
ncbi:MAG TPA: ABC transporter substrate-binding protein [Ardenticatenaceae bacterium]|nr:ABC transporter substrate-binding protein [Ardenticatenaceae bacterium]